MRHRRSTSLALLGALVAGLVLLPASAANAVVEAPTITSPSDGTTNGSSGLNVAGTVPDNGDGDRLVNVVTSPDDGVSVVNDFCQVIVPAGETAWNCSGTLPHGLSTLIAVAAPSPNLPPPNAYVSGESNHVDVNYNRGTPTISLPGDGSVTLSAADVTVSGAIPNPDAEFLTIELFRSLNGDPETSVCVTNLSYVDVSWTCDSPVGIGTNTFTALVYPTAVPTASGPTSAPSDLIRGGLTSPEISSPAPDTVISSAATFTGTGPEMGTVTIQVDGSATGQCVTQIDEFANWSCDFPALPSGSHSFSTTVQRVDGSQGGPVAPQNNSVIPPKPTTSYQLGAASIQVTVTGENGSEVNAELYEVTDGGEGYIYGEPVDGCPMPNGSQFPHTFEYDPADTISCSFTDLSPGIWNIWSGQRVFGAENGDQPDDRRNDFVYIPVAPTLALDLAADRAVVASGTGEPYSEVILETTGGNEACRAEVDGGGAWSCTTYPGSGLANYRATAQSVGFEALYYESPDSSLDGFSAYTSVVSISVPPAPVVPSPGTTPTPTPTPTVTPPPLTWTLNLGGKEQFLPGDETDVSGEGLPAGAPVEIWLHSTPVLLGTTTVGADGTFSLHVVIPEDVEPGAHKFVAIVTPPGQAPSTVEQSVIVNPLPETASVDETTSTVDPEAGSVGNRRDEPGAPSAMTHALHSVRDAFRNPAVLGGAAVAGIALLIFIALPAELLNSTISEQYGRFAKRVKPRSTLPWYTRFARWAQGSKLLGGIALTFLAALIFGFADPGFGFDITSLRVVLACGIGLFVVGYLASAISGLIIHRRWKLASVIELKPLGIALTVVGVLISRLLDFSPGFLIGLIIGIAIVGKTTDALAAKTNLVQAAVVFVLSMSGWVTYSLLSGSIDSDSFGGALLLESLVATTTEGLTALFVGLLPFRFLDGQSIFRYSKLLWGLSYVVAAAAFVLVVVLSSRNWGEITGSLWLWAIVLGGFALVSFAVWAYFRWWAPEEPEDESELQPAESAAR